MADVNEGPFSFLVLYQTRSWHFGRRQGGSPDLLAIDAVARWWCGQGEICGPADGGGARPAGAHGPGGKGFRQGYQPARILLETGEGWPGDRLRTAQGSPGLGPGRARCSMSSGALPRAGWTVCSRTGPKPTGTAIWMTGPGPISPPWPAHRLPKATNTGTCVRWRTGWWSWEWLSPCRTRRRGCT